MKIIGIVWMGVLLVCFSFFSTALADDVVSAPGVQVKSDGTVVAPGVKVSPDGDVSAPSVNVDADGSAVAVKSGKGKGGNNHVINGNAKTLDLECNGENVVVNGNNNTVTCQGKSAQVSVNGSGNTINFEGTCNKLILKGAKNRARMARIGFVSAIGSDNQITWATALKGNKPKIVSTGQNNVIKKEK